MNARHSGRIQPWITIACAVIVPISCYADGQGSRNSTQTKYRGLLGSTTGKIRREGGRTYIWAGGDTSGPGAHWYDFTGSPIPPEELQFGIGKDSIPSIDDPVFVKPNDPRLLNYGSSPYRRDDKANTVDDIRVIGFAAGDDVRAYPIALLDRHELVNDRIGGKPVVVGW